LTMTRVSSVVTPTLLVERSGRSRTTATELFAISNPVGQIGGASLGGAMLAQASFPAVGFFCAGIAVLSAAVVAFKVRDPEKIPV